jgi:hypothetical protein
MSHKVAPVLQLTKMFEQLEETTPTTTTTMTTGTSQRHRPRMLAIPTNSGPRKSHHRSRSDLVDSLCISNRWVKYEETRQQDLCGVAPLAEPESMCNVSTLNLENKGKFVSTTCGIRNYDHYSPRKNVCLLPEGPVLTRPGSLKQQTTKKPEKRTSFGQFFNKLSKAVLKPRNVYVTNEPSIAPARIVQEKQKWNVRKKIILSNNANKENVATHSVMDTTAQTEKFAAREYKRFKAEKYSVTQSKSS